MSFTRVTEQNTADIMRLYNDGLCDMDIARALGLKRHLVWYFLRQRKLPPHRSQSFLTQYNGFFHTIDTWDKAYVLGFVAADGCVSEKGIEIYIKQCDQAVLEYIAPLIGCNCPIRVGRDDDKGIYVRLRANSTVMVADLLRHGITERKSLTLEWPATVPDDLLRPFMLGYFDGDGSVAVYWTSKKLTNGSHGSPQMRPIVAVVCSWAFSESLRAFLAKHSVNCKIRPHGVNGKVALAKTSSFAQSAAWLRLMYADAKFYLTRKHDIASQIMTHKPRPKFWKGLPRSHQP